MKRYLPKILLLFKETNDEHTYRERHRKNHRFCGHTVTDVEEDVTKFSCTLCIKTVNAVGNKNASEFNLKIQTKSLTNHQEI